MSRHRPKGYGRADDWPMNPALKNLIRDVPELVDAFRALDREAVTNPHARALLSGFIWIAEEPIRTDSEKRRAVADLLQLHHCSRAAAGFVHFPSLRTFLGW